METMHILGHVVARIQDCKGGLLLNHLYDLMMEYSGNEKAEIIFSRLLETSSIPYFDMLIQWLQGGFLQDPYGEFMIHQTHLGSLDQQNFILYDDDWSKWYRLRPKHVFHSLMATRGASLDSDSTIQKILLAGKYWNAVSLCKDKSVPDVRYGYRRKQNRLDLSNLFQLTYQTTHADIRTYVNDCFEDAAQTLYNIVMRDYQLVEVLRFTKSYFLLDQGDFFIHFMDMAEDELLQEMPAVSKGRVGAWTKYSLQLGRNFPDTSTQDSGTPCKALKSIAASLQCDFALDSLVEALDHLHAASGGIQSNEPKTPSRHLYGGSEKGLTGIEAFMLSYGKRYFPLSLFLSTRTISNYQLLFRHIFFAKHVERRLVGTWLDHQMIKEYFHSLRKEMGPTYCLRHRMLHFVQNFVYYMMSEVIEPNWTRMESQILPTKNEDMESSKAPTRTVDDILKIHHEFVRASLKECLLTNRDLVRTFTKLLTTCLLFSDQMKLFMETTEVVSFICEIAI
jgi:gamma-tubulin complex component 2